MMSKGPAHKATYWMGGREASSSATLSILPGTVLMPKTTLSV